MARILSRDTEGGVEETWAYDDTTQTVGVRFQQDTSKLVDSIAKVNANGGPTEFAGMRLVAEVPETVGREFCKRRGIDWRIFAYTNKHDDEFARFCREHPALVYQHQRKYFGGVTF